MFSPCGCLWVQYIDLKIKMQKDKKMVAQGAEFD